MTVIEQMLEKYTLHTIEDKKNAIKEILQEVTLAGLARTDFFKHAAFYGGTTLRIFYGLNRFSEDLDFTLLEPVKDFDFNKYIPAVNEAVEALGLAFEANTKKKRSDTNVRSAFLKGNTLKQFLVFYPKSEYLGQIHKNEKIMIKFEIDVNPPKFATTEFKYGLLPNNYRVKVYDLPTLFAGKLHAVIARKWGNRIKGRDFYDYVFYLAKDTPVNIKHLEARLKQTMTIEEDVVLTLPLLKSILNSRFDEIDFDLAKKDVAPFIQDVDELEIWSRDFFKGITEKLTVV